MNDALASGDLAMARWTVDDFQTYTTSYTYVFTVDHQVQAFDQFQFESDTPEPPVMSQCVGPFEIGPAICTAMTDTGAFIPVDALAWGNCR